MNFNRKIVGGFLALAFLAAGAVACQNTTDNNAAIEPTGGTADMVTDAEGKLWKLVSYNETPVLAGSEITLELADGKLNGSSGCNTYFADYQIEGSQLMVDQAGSTRKACEPDVMAQETAYLNLLQQANSVIAITNSVLTIETAEGNLMFEAAS